MPSMLATVANAQQDPHWPWFFTGVTAPCSRQSKDVGRLLVSSFGSTRVPAGAGAFWKVLRAANSSCDQSASGVRCEYCAEASPARITAMLAKFSDGQQLSAGTPCFLPPVLHLHAGGLFGVR